MIKRYVHNQRGYSLLLTIFAVIFISIIGVSVLSFTLNTTRVTVNEQVNQSSYYIAEAGLVEKRAELNVLAGNAYKEVLSTYNGMPAEDQTGFDLESAFYSRVESKIDDELTFESTNTYDEQQSVTPFSNAKVTRISTSPLVYEIASAGTIPAEKTPALTKELKQRVQIQMNVDTETEVVTIPGDGTTKFQACFSVYATGDFEHGGGELKGPIYSNGDVLLNKNGATISGNVYAKGNVTLDKKDSGIIGDVYTEKQVLVNKNANVSGNIFENFNLEAAQIECIQKAPELPALQTAFPEPDIDYDRIEDHHFIEMIKDTYYFKDLSVKNNRPLVIDLKGENKTIFTDTFDLNGSIEFINPGKLELIILDEFSSGGQGSMNNGSGSMPDTLTLHYAGDQTFSYNANNPINGHLHIKTADLKLTGNSNVTGDVFVYGASDIEIKSDINTADKLIVAPNSNLTISGSGTLKGNVIVKDFTIGGNGSLEPPDSDYGEWAGPGGEEQVEVIRYSEDGSFLKTDVLVEE